MSGFGVSGFGVWGFTGLGSWALTYGEKNCFPNMSGENILSPICWGLRVLGPGPKSSSARVTVGSNLFLVVSLCIFRVFTDSAP